MTTTLYLLAVVNRGEGMIFRSSPRKEGSKLIHLLTMMNEILRRESHHHRDSLRRRPRIVIERRVSFLFLASSQTQ
ncbi:hypothetical protein F2Q70_00035357 [Brassica cretica]|uniref:Uncharacterized protein n=1 Tax=Brassica cretica TaxID=69181 RepID=A0A8S9G4B3_BRACR|nr:hypothetical protein F2Q68_00030493 [Brassica cretica]KAF2584110.1 hypothetical protein F2Q70_00035357 [Brassica cretica]